MTNGMENFDHSGEGEPDPYELALVHMQETQKQEYSTAGKSNVGEYNPDKTVYSQLFKCPKEGCLFKNLYWSEYQMHVRMGTHYFQIGK